MSPAATALPEALRAALARRVEPGAALVGEAEAISRACYAMASRFHEGGKLIVFGNGAGSTDAAHVAVEFVHPVIVGKRALPAISVSADPAVITGLARDEGLDEVFAAQVRLLADPVDIAMGISADGNCRNVLRAFEVARSAGLLTVALTGGEAGVITSSPAVDHLLGVCSVDPLVIKEVHVTTYHILWELVHVFFEQPALLGPRMIA